MIDKYIAFLTDVNMYPVKEGLWNSFLIEHKKPGDESERFGVEQYIAYKLGKVNGLYVYENMDGQTLYVGKGKPLYNRIVSHYRESFQPVPGDTKDMCLMVPGTEQKNIYFLYLALL